MFTEKNTKDSTHYAPSKGVFIVDGHSSLIPPHRVELMPQADRDYPTLEWFFKAGHLLEQDDRLELDGNEWSVFDQTHHPKSRHDETYIKSTHDNRHDLTAMSKAEHEDNLMRELNKELAKNNKESAMNTDELIPIDFARNITPLVMKDKLWSSVYDCEFEITTQGQITSFNDYSPDEDYLFVVSFAGRPNTGTQPVSDNTAVDYIMYCDSGGAKRASDVNWMDTYKLHHDVKYWKPNHAAMLKDYIASKCPAKDLLEAVENPVAGTPFELSDTKPIYTQAMCDAGELPMVGSECIHIDEANKVEILYSSNSFIIFKSDDGKEWNGGANSFKPIRTDAEKLMIAIWECIEDENRGISDSDIDSIRSGLMKKFTIILNEPTGE